MTGWNRNLVREATIELSAWDDRGIYMQSINVLAVLEDSGSGDTNH